MDNTEIPHPHTNMEQPPTRPGLQDPQAPLSASAWHPLTKHNLAQLQGEYKKENVRIRTIKSFPYRRHNGQPLKHIVYPSVYFIPACVKLKLR